MIFAISNVVLMFKLKLKDQVRKFVNLLLLKSVLCLLFMTSFSFPSDQNGICPYNHERDHEAIIQLMAKNYGDIFSKSYFDPDNKNDDTRLAYAKKQAESFKRLQENECDYIIILVMRQDDVTVGYIKYAIPKYFPCTPIPCLQIKGRIEQLAIHEDYRGQKLGEQLCLCALDDFLKRDLWSASVCTTTSDVGKRFYYKRLGFKENGLTQSPMKEMIYFWKKQLQPITFFEYLKRYVKK